MANISTLFAAKLAPYAPASLAPSVITGGDNITLPHTSSLMNNATCCLTVGEAATFANTFCYCQTTGQCCLFTVPSGVTDVQFQIWGAGATSNICNIAICCAFFPPGGSGEYTYVRMRVTAGQTYTLCAGGQPCQSGGCANCLNGCASFVCGSNSTCIASLGGSSFTSLGSYYMCYPRSNVGCVNFFSTWFVQPQSHSAFPFSIPAYRTTNVGNISSTNTINMSAKVPSMTGYVTQCGAGVLYMQYTGLAIQCDHTIDIRNSGYMGFSDIGVGIGGCDLAANSTFNYPGAGGPPAISACFCGLAGYCGIRGRSGLILVKMR